ncbi:RNA-binding protein YRA1 NDAI_0A04440 [Naumovozyma dairenensis CBS 421]|uniref:RRM domain-containing protein n=1 Tax=Naumovozyma dairenensis (strain ATCC 10597 / BCRC 20456 / CBS 421 / NBRC 0211 / NRRL Y-12639) TaxID=1071378 RepID=G0W462_NAUDC|nr:hypothetical protein NDAI_0A04440 [Naumovozyma dairenensis CBS 421]CCD22600.1 hypothetical protein NDAI_0A04440 [Naumovozyma dairenensis CBS 421]
MSANLDQSLDEIIGSNKRMNNRARITSNRGRAAGPRKTSKQVNTRRQTGRPNPVRQRVTRAPVNVRSRVPRPDAGREVRVNVEGLPRDIKQDAVREFFSSQIGGVDRVLLSYNERGQSTGMATITFRNNQQASAAVAKFNGAPIDAGRSRLKMNLLVDPNQQPVKSLVDRIRPLPQKRVQQQQQQQPKQQQQRQVRRAPNKKAAVAKDNRRQRKEKPAKKV